jgi:hypothetical protein
VIAQHSINRLSLTPTKPAIAWAWHPVATQSRKEERHVPINGNAYGWQLGAGCLFKAGSASEPRHGWLSLPPRYPAQAYAEAGVTPAVGNVRFES